MDYVAESQINNKSCSAFKWDKQNQFYTFSDSIFNKRIVSWKSVVMYGLCLSLAGHYVGWTVSLNAGFWEVFGTTFLIGTATGCLMLCIAEMTAALPFSGGTYGVVRVTLGDLPGYLVGTCEVLQNVLYVAFTVGALAKYVTIMTGYDNKFEPLYWVVFYLTIGIITSNHRTLFWRSMWVFGIFMCVMLLLYCTMTRTEDVDFAKYTKDSAVANVSLDEQYSQFFKQLPLPSFFFNLSIKLLPLACRAAKNPTSDVPMAMYIVYAVSIVSAFSILFCASSIAPGVSVLRKFPAAPLSFGFSSIFNISVEQSVAFTMLSQYASCLGFTFAFTQQMAALSKSGFLWNSRKWGFVPDRYDNVVSLLVGCGFGYLLNVLIFYWSKDVGLYSVTLFRLLGYSINLVVFVTYIVFRSKFPSLIKKFHSPLGVSGAVYGLLVYLVVWGCIGALSDVGNHWLPFVLLVCFLVIWSLPFFLYYRYHLTFSEEESTVLFIAYVISANKARRLQKLRNGSPLNSCRRSVSYTPHSKRTFSQRWRSSTKEDEPEFALSAVRLAESEQKKLGDKEGGSAMRGGAAALDNSVLEFEPIQKAALYMEKLTQQEDYAQSLPRVVSTHSTSPQLSPSPPPEAVTIGPIEPHAGVERKPSASFLPPHINTKFPDRGDRVVPMQQPVQETMSHRKQRSATLDNVLSNELGYDEDVVGHLRTEIQEYYGSNHLSGADHSEGDDENV